MPGTSLLAGQGFLDLSPVQAHRGRHFDDDVFGADVAIVLENALNIASEYSSALLCSSASCSTRNAFSVRGWGETEGSLMSNPKRSAIG